MQDGQYKQQLGALKKEKGTSADRKHWADELWGYIESVPEEKAKKQLKYMMNHIGKATEEQVKKWRKLWKKQESKFVRQVNF